jgi:hypothetical protein
MGNSDLNDQVLLHSRWLVEPRDDLLSVCPCRIPQSLRNARAPLVLAALSTPRRTPVQTPPTAEAHSNSPLFPSRHRVTVAADGPLGCRAT